MCVVYKNYAELVTDTSFIAILYIPTGKDEYSV